MDGLALVDIRIFGQLIDKSIFIIRLPEKQEDYYQYCVGVLVSTAMFPLRMMKLLELEYNDQSK